MRSARWSNLLSSWIRRSQARSTLRRPVRHPLTGRTSHIQSLESRRLLSSMPMTTIASPEWFQVVDPMAGRTVVDSAAQPAGGTFWNVQLVPETASHLTAVSATADLFNRGDVAFTVVKGLGGVGQVQIQTWGAANQSVREWLASNPAVSGFEQDFVVTIDATPSDTSFAQMWALNNVGQTGGIPGADIEAVAAWDKSLGNSRVVVAVLDTGINYNHSDLAANIWTNPGEIADDGIDNDGNGFVDDVHGWDFVNNDSDPLDDHGHGTHIAGTIGAVGNNATGVTGINWNVSLMALKFIASSGSGTNSDAIAALNYCTMMSEKGVNLRATNNSWGGGAWDAAMVSAISANNDAGIMFVAAAGNNASNNDVNTFYPANYPLGNVLSVAATDKNDSLASFSNYGATAVHLAAPGVSILSTARNGGYSTMSGTSMATPHVAGVVALAAAYTPDATVTQIRSAILSGVDLVPALTGKTLTGGRLNARKTLEALDAQQGVVPGRYLAASHPYESLDLVPGTGVITVVDGSASEIAALNLGTNTFRFYGIDYTGANSLFVSSNGLITFGSANPSPANSNLMTAPSQPAIAPFWDDLVTASGGTGRILARFDDLNADLVADRLVIEWSQVTHAPSSTSSATFQAILSLNSGSDDGQIIFNYPDLGFGSQAYDQGASATVGISAGGGSASNRLLISRDYHSNPLVQTGTAILFDRTRPDAIIAPVPTITQASLVPTVTVSFDRPIDESTLSFSDFTLVREGQPIALNDSLSFANVGNNVYEVRGLETVAVGSGNYTLTLDMSGVQDLPGHAGRGTQSTSWTASFLPTNLRMISATADGLSTMTIVYEIESASIDPFDVGFYSSSDTFLDSNDNLTGVVTISDPTELSVGVHSKTITIGTGAGMVPLPGAGAADTAADDYVLVAADPENLVAETDPSGMNSDNTVAFQGMYHLPGKAVWIQGGNGIDSVTSTGTTTIAFNGASITLPISDFTDVVVRVHGGNDVVNLASLTKLVTLYGGDGDDLLSGGNQNDLLFGGAGNDTLLGNAGADSLTADGGNDSLRGGTGNDLYRFDLGTPLGADSLNESDGGSDTIDFSKTTAASATLNLGIATQQAVSANLLLTLGSSSTFENIVGTGGGDLLTGNSLANSLTGGAGNDTLAGSSGNDIYRFDADGLLGSDSIVELVSGGTDTLDFADTTTVAITIDLSLTTVQTVAAETLSITLSAGDVLENATGGAMGDTLTGNSRANTLTSGAGNDTLTGGTGNDTFRIDADTTQGSDTLVEVAGGGTDLIDYSTTTTKSVSLDLALVGVSQVAVPGASTLTLLGGDFENAAGGALSDLLVGNSLANQLTGNGGNDLLSGRGGNDTLIGGAGNDSLDGGDGDDSYSFKATTVLGTDTIAELPDTGADRLDFSTTTVGIHVDLANPLAQAVNSFLTLALGNNSAIESVTGGSQADTILGNSRPNLLDGRGGNDSVTGGQGDDSLIGGSGNDTLAGGLGNDAYPVLANSALGSDLLVEQVNEGNDLLDFSQTTSSGVTLDLSQTVSQVVNSYLSVTLSSGDTFEMIVGTNKADILTGNPASNVLVGGSGADLLDGLAGRDLIVGGTGADVLDGGHDDDLLISGSIAYYSETVKVLDTDAVNALLNEWRSASSFSSRITNLRLGVAGGFRLDGTTVTTDGTAKDTLTGASGLDWFWIFDDDSITDLDVGGVESIN